jgi:hypothetical protein
MRRDDLQSVSVRSEDSGSSPQRDSATAREWAVMFYLAGDNDLSPLIDAKVASLVHAGSTDSAGIAVQFDRGGTSGAERRRIPGANETAEIEPLGAINTGDKKPLIDFIQFATATIPAKRRIVTIWNHGRGLDPHHTVAHTGHAATATESALAKFDRASMARIELASVSPALRSALFPVVVLKKVRQRLSRESAAAGGSNSLITVQSIAHDVTSKDHLDNKELQEVMTAVAPTRAKRIDIVAFEACLMNTIEVAYQLRDSVKFIVGSQSNYPQPGWPYAELIALLQNAATPSQEMAVSITRVAASVTAGRYLTASALDLSKAGALTSKVSSLAEALNAAVDDPAVRKTISYAHHTSQAFADSETIDLAHFCSRLAEFVTEPAILKAANDVLLAVPKFVIACESRGADVANARGISIYFPKRDFISPEYGKLDFARDSTWPKFLTRYVKLAYGRTTPAPPAAAPPPPGTGHPPGHGRHHH